MYKRYVDINNGIFTGLLIGYGITQDDTLLLIAAIIVLVTCLLILSGRNAK